MKRRLGIAAAVVVGAVVVALAALRVVGVAPKDQRPGLWLPGNVVTTPVTDWSFTDSIQEIHIETRTPYFVPHSVTIQCVNVNGQLYIASFQPGPERRRWNRNVIRDPRVRLHIGDQLFERRAVPVTDPSETEAVFQANLKKYPAVYRRVSELPASERPPIFFWRMESL